MKLLLLFLTVFQLHSAMARPVSLAKYFDCMEKTNFITDSIPVFTRVAGGNFKTSYAAGDFAQGLWISMTTKDNGTIEQFQLGEKITFSPEELETGLEFGVFMKTAHTLQLVDFNPSTGGKLQFGFLKNVFSKKNGIRSLVTQNINNRFELTHGNNWGNFEVYLVRDPVTNEWKIRNEESHDVLAIFGFMTMKNKFLVKGISSMSAVTNMDREKELKCPRGTVFHAQRTATSPDSELSILHPPYGKDLDN
jgi:hypothetical protein